MVELLLCLLALCLQHPQLLVQAVYLISLALDLFLLLLHLANLRGELHTHTTAHNTHAGYPTVPWQLDTMVA